MQRLEINQIWVHHDLNRKRNWDKDDVVQKHNGILLGHKTEHNNVICSNMDGLKLIILSKVSQTETNT